MAGMGTIGNVLGASLSSRLPKQVDWAVIGIQWDDSQAYEAIRHFTNGGLAMYGDQVTLIDVMGGYCETRRFDGLIWSRVTWAMTAPQSDICPECAGAGKKHIVGIVGPITCPGCSGSGKLISTESQATPTQPGIDDELKPNLPKRLRDW